MARNVVILNEMSADERVQEMVRLREKWERDEKSAIKNAEKRGEKRGEKIGEKRGIEKGEEIGLNKAAQRMRESGMTEEQIKSILKI